MQKKDINKKKNRLVHQFFLEITFLSLKSVWSKIYASKLNFT